MHSVVLRQYSLIVRAACVHVCMYACVHVCMRVCVCVCVRACVHVHGYSIHAHQLTYCALHPFSVCVVHVCMCVCVCVCVCVCAHSLRAHQLTYSALHPYSLSACLCAGLLKQCPCTLRLVVLFLKLDCSKPNLLVVRVDLEGLSHCI